MEFIRQLREFLVGYHKQSAGNLPIVDAELFANPHGIDAHVMVGDMCLAIASLGTKTLCSERLTMDINLYIAEYAREVSCKCSTLP